MVSSASIQEHQRSFLHEPTEPVQNEQALAACEQVLRLDPNYALAYNGKGNALSDLKQY